MRKRTLFLGGVAVAVGLALIALPNAPAAPQESADARLAQMEKRIDDLQTRQAERLAGEQEKTAELMRDRALRSAMRTADRIAREQERGKIETLETPDGGDAMVFLGDEGTSWLGVESQEVS